MSRQLARSRSSTPLPLRIEWGKVELGLPRLQMGQGSVVEGVWQHGGFY